MKMQHGIRILSVLLMVFITLAASSPAFAYKGLTHDQFFLPFSGDELWSEEGTLCNFNIFAHTEGYILVNYWVDENDQWRIQFTVEGQVHRILSADPTFSPGSKTVKVEQHGPAHWEYTYLPDNVQKWQVKSVGTYLYIIVPGFGPVWGGAGLMEESAIIDFTDPNNPMVISYSLVRQNGNWNFNPGGPLCDYLRP